MAVSIQYIVLHQPVAILATIRYSFIIFIMNISLSKLAKNYQQNNRLSPSCNLLDFQLLQQKVIYRKRSLSRRNSLNKGSSNSSNGLKLFKNLYNIDHSTKSNSSRLNDKHEQATYKKKSMEPNPQFLAPKQHIQQQKIHIKNQRCETEYHGSWGIPKYSKQSPTRATFQWRPVKQAAKNKELKSIVNNLQQPPVPIYMRFCQHETPIKCNSSRTSQSFRFDKGNLSTQYTKNQTAGMKLSGKSIEQSLTFTPTQSQVLLSPYTQISNQLPKSNIQMFLSKNSGLQRSICSLQHIENLQDIREVRSHCSRDLNGSKMHDKTLNQSLVIGNDVNQQGFWK